MQWQSTDILSPTAGHTVMLSQLAGNKWQRTLLAQCCIVAKKSKQLCMHVRDDNIELQFMAFNDFTHFLHFCSSMTEGGSP